MNISRRDFLKKGVEFVCLSAMLGCNRSLKANDEKIQEFEIFPVDYEPNPFLFSDQIPVVSIVSVNNKWSEAKGIEYASARAIELIGGTNEVAKDKNRILLKPNLVNPNPSDTTNPIVIEALAKLMKNSGKEVYIGEAGAASMRNIDTSIQGYVCRNRNTEILQAIQDDIFKGTGYDDLSKRTGIPLVNLHVGNMVKANKLGLSVIDATTAMQGQGPSISHGGTLVDMNLIIASKNALAADMVAANVMGFEPIEIDTFKWAWKAGMNPSNINDIQIVGEKIETVRQQFQRPQVVPYTMISDWYGPPCG